MTGLGALNCRFGGRPRASATWLACLCVAAVLAGCAAGGIPSTVSPSAVPATPGAPRAAESGAASSPDLVGPTSTGPVEAMPPESGAPASAVSISAGGYHDCAVFDDGTVRCWGSNDHGQLGDGTVSDVPVTTPVVVHGITTAVAVSAGSLWHTCALLADGTVRCWGHNSSGELGDGTTTDRTSPVAVPGITTATAISAGFEDTCVLLADGTVRCWGQNFSGQLGGGMHGDFRGITTPVAVTGVRTATAVSAGIGHTCAVLTDGTIRCWGNNVDTSLGDGTREHRDAPVVVSGITTATAVSAAEQTCAVLADGTVRCWGQFDCGPVETVSTADNCTRVLAPVTAPGITTAVAVAAGGIHACALLADGEVRCWGSNVHGELGDPTRADSPVPVMVPGIVDAVAISSSGEHTCALLADGEVRCWGSAGVSGPEDGTT
jgi:alpha-tubulin suppressor-like RCC1 family protein